MKLLNLLQPLVFSLFLVLHVSAIPTGLTTPTTQKPISIDLRVTDGAVNKISFTVGHKAPLYFLFGFQQKLLQTGTRKHILGSFKFEEKDGGQPLPNIFESPCVMIDVSNEKSLQIPSVKDHLKKNFMPVDLKSANSKVPEEQQFETTLIKPHHGTQSIKDDIDQVVKYWEEMIEVLNPYALQNRIYTLQPDYYYRAENDPRTLTSGKSNEIHIPEDHLLLNKAIGEWEKVAAIVKPT